MRPLLPFLLVAILLPDPALAQEQADGEQLFRSRCASCHTLDPGPARIGPPLAGVLGRKAGSVEGARYSPALKASGLVWSGETLDRYLANPRAAVPGTTMAVALPNEAQRRAVIAFLREAPGGR